MSPKTKKRKLKGQRQDHGYADVDPEPTSEDFLYDDVDKFHKDQDKLLLSKGVPYENKLDLKRTEEVLNVASDSDDDDERIKEYERQLKRFKASWNHETMGSDIASDEEQSSILQDDLPSDADDDQLEEREAIELQKKLNAYLEEDDFGLSLINITTSSSASDFQKIGKDLESLTEKEKRTLLKHESPELFKLVDELKSKLSFVLKFHSTIISSDDHMKKLYLKLVLDYCVNLSFYLALKFEREDVTNHPVIDRICYYNDVLKSFTTGKLICGDSVKISDATEMSSFIKDLEKNQDIESSEEEEEEETARRAINKTIEKNRGLTPHRKKENKNPRVKHRNKYRKTKIRRRGQIREPRKELNKYGGEISGIKPGIKRSIKMK